MKKFLLRLFLFFWVPVLLAIVWTVFVVVCDCRSYRAALEVPDGSAEIPRPRIRWIRRSSPVSSTSARRRPHAIRTCFGLGICCPPTRDE